MKRWIIIILCVLANRMAMADDDFSKEVFKATQLTPTIYMLEGAGGNITALIGKDGVLLVDCDFSEMADKLVSKLKDLKGANPRYIINTHFHYDHTGGNQVFGSTATIIAATPVRTRLMSEQILWKKTHPAFEHKGLPILTFDESVTLHVNDAEIEAIHYPHGHTDGDTVVFFNEGKVVSLGDLYFAGLYPIFHPEHKGSLSDYVRNVESIIKRIPKDAQVVPGHGPLSNRSELEAYHRMIVASIAVVRAGIKEGLTLDQIQKAGLPKEWEPYSHGYRTTEQWLSSIYESLQSKP